MATRVTLQLDEDVAGELQKRADQMGRSLEEVTEEVVKNSIRASMPLRPLSKPSPPFEVRAKALHARPGINFDDIEELLEQVEGPAHR